MGTALVVETEASQPWQPMLERALTEQDGEHGHARFQGEHFPSPSLRNSSFWVESLGLGWTFRAAGEGMRSSSRVRLESLRWVRRPEVWIPALYGLVSSAWIVASDLLVGGALSSGRPWVTWSMAKGLAFVVVTGLGLHALLRGTFERQRRAETALREADELKTHFFAMLSHELRNPLAPMRNALWLLEREPSVSPRATAARETLARQVLHLTRVTDDLVDVARSSRGQIELRRSRLDLTPLVRDAVQDHEHLFTARRIALNIDLGSLATWVDVDPTRLGQVIGNLLSNAARFTDPGGQVRISVERASGGMALLRVSDDGAGIDPRLLPHVFESFVQGETTLDRPRGGLGLGLALVKSIVDLHGGAVRARSAGPGRGTEITVEIPLASESPALATTPHRAKEAMPHHRVLVIEDHPDAAESLREMLLLWDQDVEVAHDGREGIEKARVWHPDLVLCDIGLPILDGYAVARAIRSSPDSTSTYLVAITGYASPEDQRQAANAGFDRHLGKPVPVETLVDLLSTADRSGAARQ